MVSGYGCFVWGIFIFLSLQGRVCDSFQDGDFTSGPEWVGDRENFIVSKGSELQLMAPGGGVSSLFLPAAFSPEMSWEMYVNLDFEPSASNRLRIFLAADDSDAQPGRGYYLEIGETGNEDAVKLYYLENGEQFELAESAPGIAAAQPVEGILKVFATGGWWHVYFEVPGFPAERMISFEDGEMRLDEFRYFGFVCMYTASRRDRFYFDDICIGPYIPDTVPPGIIGAQATDPHSLVLAFNEEIEPDGISTDQFRLFPGEFQPGSLVVQGREVVLSFDKEFLEGTAYTLEIASVSDTSGNTARHIEIAFEYILIVQATAYDWLIHEIMPDPNPPVSLPGAEYVEIYHNGLSSFDLGDYALKVGNRMTDLGEQVVSPGSFVILCSSADTAHYSGYGTVAGLEQMPVLPNEGATVEILDGSGNIIHAVSYSREWFQDSKKDDGGWSLEMVNTEYPCAGMSNWRASTDLRGGTPGAPNSLEETYPDLEGPVALAAIPAGSQSLRVRFDEVLSGNGIGPAKFSLMPEIRLEDAILIGPDEVKLTFSDPLAAGTVYTLTISDVMDCLGNPAKEQLVRFGLPQPVDPGDLVINEILFNPATGGSRFVEVLNCSDDVLDANGLVIGGLGSHNAGLKRIGVSHLIFPGDLVVFAEHRQDILDRYQVPDPGHLVETDLPVWGSARGNVSLLSDGAVIDSFTYSEGWHHPLLGDVNGVSLERISKQMPTHARDSWQSAAASAGYATPTGQNSQFVRFKGAGMPYRIQPRIFSPDHDGYADFLLIIFEQEDTQVAGSVYIYDTAGNYIRCISKNETIGTEAAYQWDGTNDRGELQEVGTYLIFIEIFNPEGLSQRFREVCVLARKF